jgi:hypothetical protein
MATPPFPRVKGDYFTGWITARMIRRLEVHGRLFRTAYEGKTLRAHYGLAEPASQFE